MLPVRCDNGISHTCIIAQDHTGMYSYFTRPIFHLIIPHVLFHSDMLSLEVHSVLLDQQDKA